MKIKEISYIILSFILISTFISIFFFTYVSKVEEEIVKSQIKNSIDNLVSSSNLFLTERQKFLIKDVYLKNVKAPDMSEEDANIDKNNSALLRKTIIIFSCIVGVGLLIVFGLWYKYRFNIKEVVLTSFIILVLVALTEIFFVTYVTKNFLLIDENYLSYVILSNLKNYADS